VGGSCEYGNETSASVNCMEFFDSLKNYSISISLPRWTLLKGVSLSGNKAYEQVWDEYCYSSIKPIFSHTINT
jgi:hypothetical protein